MFIKMIRTQNCKSGHYMAGVIYQIDENDGPQNKDAERFLERKFAKKITGKELTKIKKQIAADAKKQIAADAKKQIAADAKKQIAADAKKQIAGDAKKQNEADQETDTENSDTGSEAENASEAGA